MALADEIRNLRARQAANNNPRRGATPKPRNAFTLAPSNAPSRQTSGGLGQALRDLIRAPSGGGRQLQTGGPIEFQQMRELQAAQERAQRAREMFGSQQQPMQQPMPLAQQDREMFLAQQAAQQQIKQQMQQQMQQQMPGQFTGVPFGSMPTGNGFPQLGTPIGFQNPAMLQDAQERAIRAGGLGMPGFMNPSGLFGQPNMGPYPMGPYPVGGAQPMQNFNMGYPAQQPNMGQQQPKMGQQPQYFGPNTNMGQQYPAQQPNMNQQYGGNSGFPMTNMGQQQQPQSTNGFDSFAYRPL